MALGPEEYLWFHLAHELGWPVSYVKQMVTVSEFEKWQTYFTQRTAQRDKADYHAAQIERAIIAVNSTKPVGSLDTFVIDFEAPVAEAPVQTKTREQLMREQQLMHMQFCGAEIPEGYL